MVIVAAVAAGVHVMTLTAPALAEQARQSRAAQAAAERTIVPRTATASSDGMPVPALVGGIVLAFAVGLTAGQVHRRRRVGARRRTAAARPLAAVAAPARPAPPPPEPAAAPAPKPVDIAPAPVATPAPPPPEPRPAPPRVVRPPAPPVQPPPRPPAPVEPVEPPEPVEPVEAPRVEAPEPVHPPRIEAPEPVHPPRIEAPEPVQPAADAPLTDAPEVPRPPEDVPSGASGPTAPLTEAPESLTAPPAPSVPPPAPARRFARATPWPADAVAVWTCEIDWKAGYRKSSFRAMAAPPGSNKREPVGDSPAIQWALMGDPEPPTPELAVRVRALMTALEEAGWQHIGRGQRWYSQRFLWRGAGEPQTVAVPEPARAAEPPEA